MVSVTGTVAEQLIVDDENVIPPGLELIFMKTTAATTTIARTRPPMASIRGVTLMPALAAAGALGVPGGFW